MSSHRHGQASVSLPLSPLSPPRHLQVHPLDGASGLNQVALKSIHHGLPSLAVTSIFPLLRTKLRNQRDNAVDIINLTF
jgi:hypothetical protein